MMNGMNEESTCRMTVSPMDEWTKLAKWMNTENMHLRE